jgi:hypothetical protein
VTHRGEEIRLRAIRGLGVGAGGLLRRIESRALERLGRLLR